MQQRFQSVLKKFWQTVQRLRRGKQNPVHKVFNVGAEFLSSTESLVGRWKEYIEDLLTATNRHSEEAAKPEDFGLGSPIIWVEVFSLSNNSAVAVPRGWMRSYASS